MTTTIATTDTASALSGTAARRALAPSGLIGGIGGLCFVASVIVQNALRANFPANDASADQVMTYYADHRSVTLILAALFPVGAVGLAAFVGALVTRVVRGAGRTAAIAGVIGAAGIVANYTMLVASDMAIAGYIHRGAANLAVVDGMWVFHNAVFGVLLASIGIALACFTAAGAASGLLAPRWRTAGLIGGILLLAAAATTPAIIDASATMFAGLLGFVVWIVFMASTSVKLLRHRHD
jgi:hypothetical protein